jgi:ABC-2 type transport system permease protein
MGFAVEEAKQSYTLAVSAQGVFESAFKGKPSPLSMEEEPAQPGEVVSPTPASPTSLGSLDVSPDTARLVVISSAEFVDDIVFDISAQLTRDRYLNSLKLMQNAVAWSVEDLDLLDIRARGTQSRVLAPMTERDQTFWESANYIVALLGLVAIGVAWNTRRSSQRPMELIEPGEFPTLTDR